MIFQKAFSNRKKGVKIGGDVVGNIGFADYTIIQEEIIEDLPEVTVGVSRESDAVRLIINIKKIKYMGIKTIWCHDTHLSLDGKEIEKVNKYKYLGAIINKELDQDEEVLI